MNLGTLKKSLPLFVLLLLVVGSVSLLLHYNNQDIIKKNLNEQRDYYENMLQKKIAENKILSGQYYVILDEMEKVKKRLEEKKLERDMSISQEEFARSKKDAIQNQINAYIHNDTGTTEVFPTNRNVQKLSTTKMSNPWKGSPSSLSTTQHLEITQIHNLTK